jgi:hypothetical protein
LALPRRCLRFERPIDELAHEVVLRDLRFDDHHR